MPWASVVQFLFGWLVVFALSPFASLAAGTGPGQTNEANLIYLPAWVDFQPPPPTEVLVDNFSAQVLTSDSFAFDHFFGPASRLSWLRRFNAQGYRAIEKVNSAAAGMFESIGADSLRDAVAVALPGEYWQDQWTGWLGESLAGTIGDAEEEHVDYTSISYSALRSTWESSHGGAGFSWGFRPWRTNPYLYLLAHAGHFEQRPLLTLEGRSGYSLFGSTKLEGRLSLALPAAFQLSAAGSLDPARMHMHEHSTARFALTLERVLHLSGRAVPDAVFFLGFRAGQTSVLGEMRQESMALIGLCQTW
jgi:hypothetical protein